MNINEFKLTDKIFKVLDENWIFMGSNAENEKKKNQLLELSEKYAKEVLAITKEWK